MFSLLLRLVLTAANESSPVSEGESPQEILDAWANQPIEEPGFTQVIIALVVVLVMIFVAFWLLRRFSFGGAAKGRRGRLKIVESLPLGGKRMIQVVRVHDRNLVVGVTGERIDLLTELSEEEVENTPVLEEKEERSFGKIFPFQGKGRIPGRVKVNNCEG
ncbi:MAG: flagellar biosynthetic protein FliO [Planctomycetota bacterium]|jgi:flagellar protein FliO/FliZ